MTASAPPDEHAGPHYEELPAPPPFDRWIRCVWFLRGPTDGAPQTIVPDGRAEIILHFADPFAQLDGGGQARVQPRALASGQLTGPLRLAPGRFADIVGIRLRTAAARAVFGVPQHEMTDALLPLRELAPPLEAALLDAAAWRGPAPERVRRIALAIAREARREPAPAAVAACAALSAAGTARIDALAQAVGLTPRTLERRVREEVGLAPRELRSVLRFRRAFPLLGASPAGRWGEVAQRAGYYDQAHMIREFKRFAGATPSRFFGGGDDLARAILGEA